MLKQKIPGYLLMILGPLTFGILMLYGETQDGIPTIKDSVAFITIAIISFGVALFFLCWMIRDIIKSKKNKH